MTKRTADILDAAVIALSALTAARGIMNPFISFPRLIPVLTVSAFFVILSLIRIICRGIDDRKERRRMIAELLAGCRPEDLLHGAEDGPESLVFFWESENGIWKTSITSDGREFDAMIRKSSIREWEASAAEDGSQFFHGTGTSAEKAKMLAMNAIAEKILASASAES